MTTVVDDRRILNLVKKNPFPTSTEVQNTLSEDEVDSLNPVLRDNPQLHEEVKAWVKEHKVQEIFMQDFRVSQCVIVFLLGPYSLNGYRVRVYRQDSATQWFTGIITHHDLFTRTMIVMNDQVYF
ncbi:unnamed protein product [Ranitomeya imitator]|uniref:Lysine-specific demethylase 3A/B tudor domain-containing protein n=1 Tax=Ranitomeya imitator TaxID=111125 RepID=A0ABN9LWV5_9NEOB|nr:unnamed protein product [Ranitomeya imitator]